VLNDLFVHEQGRRKGVGSKLISAAVEFARSQGAIHLTLSTATTNTTAQDLYESVGWKRDKQFYVYHFAVQG